MSRVVTIESASLIEHATIAFMAVERIVSESLLVLQYGQATAVHTILRLPTGIFYAQGVKANVLFFNSAPKDGHVHIKGVWFYDLRTSKYFMLKTRPLKFDDLQDFIACDHSANRHERSETERFKFYRYDELSARDKASLDVFWLKDDSLGNLDDPLPPRRLGARRIPTRRHLRVRCCPFELFNTTTRHAGRNAAIK